MKGIFPAMVTPLTSDGRLAQKAIKQLVEFHLDAGVDGFYVSGNTGEGLLLDRQTRAELFDQVVSVVDRRSQVIAHVGAMTTAEACFLALRAAEAGADAISAMSPLVYKVDFNAIRAYYRAIADATDIPLYIYYIPALTNISFSLDQILQLADDPNIAGIKFSDYNLYLMQQLRAERQQF